MRLRFVVVLAVVTGCQQYDFEPVEPLALIFQVKIENKSGTNLRPNVVALVDRSGSMAQPIDPNDPSCTSGCGVSGVCPAACATRSSELKRAMSGFFAGPARGLARWSLAVFPEAPQVDQCSASSAFLEPLPPAARTDDAASLAQWAQGADRVSTALQALTFGGGTPTAASLSYVGQTPGFGDATDSRADFVLLLTDGLPNCAPENPSSICSDTSAAQRAACACTLASCDPSSVCALGCLDQGGTVGAVQALSARGVSTLVVGFGADTNTPAAARVLNQMALAGGSPRACSTDADCGAGGCNGGVCAQAFFHASGAAELTQVLAEVLAHMGPNPCTIELGGTLDADARAAVRAGDVWYPSGPDTWALSGSTVTLKGALCERARAATPTAPLNIEVRVIQRF